MRSGILTLTTDFGSGGPYVAALKGIVLGLAPGTQLVAVGAGHLVGSDSVQAALAKLGYVATRVE